MTVMVIVLTLKSVLAAGQRNTAVFIPRKMLTHIMSNKSEERKILRTDWKELPIDKKLSQILLQMANVRAALLNYLEAIPDRATYDSYKGCVSTAEEHLINAMMEVGGDLLAQQFVGKLIEPK